MNRLIQLILLMFIIIFLNGCGDLGATYKEWPASIHNFVNLSQTDIDSLSTSISDLNSGVGEEILRIGGPILTGYPIVISKVSSFPGFPNRIGFAIQRADHCAIEIKASVFSDASLLRTTLWHELGHCAGLPHVSQSGEIMSPSIGGSYSGAVLDRFFESLLISIGN